ncbi:MAG: GAF domain-containing sensor histidine kinase, partial [Chloroflexota bacterium]
PKERWMERITQDLLSIPARLQPGTMEQLLSGEKPLRVSDVDAEGLPENAVDAGIESILLVPMRSESYDAGMLLCMSRQGSPMHEEDNALAVALSEMVATAVDVQSTLLDLRRAIKLRDMSISTASHELRNGLATTKSLAQMSLRAIKTDSVGGKAKAETHLEMILRQIDWLTDLTGVVFDVSRIDNGQIELKREPTSLNSVVVGVIERFRGIMAEHTKLRLNVVLPNVQLMGSWDRERVDQVLTNLLANAIKYSPKGGLLTVRVEQKDPRETNHEKLEERRSGLDAVRLAVVAISDQGIGIPSNQQASIFEPYYRATNVPKELAGGLGLGLHICKGIVEAHGGDLWVESEEGRGSTFYFSLPLES